MRVKKTVRGGSVWAAVAALVVSPLVTAPLVSAAPPSQTASEQSAPADATPQADTAVQVTPGDGVEPDRGSAVGPDAAAQHAPATEQAAESSAAAEAGPESPSAPEPDATSSSGDEQEGSASKSAKRSESPSGTAEAKNSAQAPAAPSAPATEAKASEVQALAAAPAGTATIRVPVYSDRTGTGSTDATALAGLTLKLQYNSTFVSSGYYPNGGGTAATTWTDSGLTCTSDASGSCDVALTASSIPDDASYTRSGNGKNARYTAAPQPRFTSNGVWKGGELRLVQMSVPTGYTAINDIRRYQTNPTTVNFDVLLPATTLANASTGLKLGSTFNTLDKPTSTSGTMTASRPNPAVQARCNLRVGLAVDTSLSIDSTEMNALKTAGKAFVSTLANTPTTMGAWFFSGTVDSGRTVAPRLLTDVVSGTTQASRITSAINGLPSSGSGYTNWDDVLRAADGNQLDVVVLLTDGVATAWGGSGTGTTSATGGHERAVWAANALKKAGTKVVVLGVGSDVLLNNITSVSGSQAGTSGSTSLADYYFAKDYASLGSTLQDLADTNCSGTVNITKKLTDDEGSTTNASALPGVKFTVTDGTSTQTQTDANGTISYSIALGSAASKTVTVTETNPGTNTVQKVSTAKGLRNARCVDGAGAELAVTDVGAFGFSVTAAKGASVNCTMYNKPAPKTASVKVTHTWVDENGALLTDAEVLEVLQALPVAQLSAGGQSQTLVEGTVHTTYKQGTATKDYLAKDVVTLGSDRSGAKAKTGVKCTASMVDESADLGQKTLAAGANAYVLRYRLSCTTELTLVKQVKGGTAKAVGWELSANGTKQAQGQAVKAAPGTYTLTEKDVRTDKAEKYDLTSLACAVGGGDATALDLGSPTIAVKRGTSVTCTFVNAIVKIGVDKTAFAGNLIPGDLSGAFLTGSTVTPGTYTFLYTVKNTGAADVKITKLADSKLSGATVQCTRSANLVASWKNLTQFSSAEATLAAGATLYCKATGPIG